MAFIKQEALEKAREIKVKADEEFAIEKVCYVLYASANSAQACRAVAVVTNSRPRPLGQARKAGTAGDRRLIREEAQGC